MRSTLTLEVTITHTQNLPDAQKLADLTGKLLTEAMQADPQLLATARLAGATMYARRGLPMVSPRVATRKSSESARWSAFLALSHGDAETYDAILSEGHFDAFFAARR